LIFSEPVPLTPIQALTFLIDSSLSKAKYNDMRASILPAGAHVTETFAQVSFQNLLNHTASRIILMHYSCPWIHRILYFQALI